tara:strand:- start:268 stop:390 length:123 start_codon:yes stop_codon:yes gene_type:complete
MDFNTEGMVLAKAGASLAKRNERVGPRGVKERKGKERNNE